jgi:formate-dependent nitrite reductase membrane component NrfD
MTDYRYMVDFTFQKQWVERRGLFLLTAIFLGGVGGGLYLVSLLMGLFQGLVIGFLIVLLGKTTAHLLFLGRPARFWRAFVRPQTSWLSRGLIALVYFLIVGALQIAPSLSPFTWLPWTTDSPVMVGLAALGAFAIITYTGFLMGVVNAIPFWNAPLLPVLFIVYSLLGGVGLTLGLAPTLPQGAVDIAILEGLAVLLLLTAAVIIAAYLWVMYYSSPAARRSAVELIRGRASRTFILGVLVLGLAIPLATGVWGLLSGVPPEVLVVAAACELAGGFSLRYSLLRAGIYAPMI